MLTGIEAPLSQVILLVSISIIFLSVLKFNIKINYWPFKVWLLFFIFYLYVGLITLLIDSSFLSFKTNVYEMFRMYASTIIILSAYFVGYSVIYKWNTDFSLLKHITPYLVFSTLFVLLAPVVGLTEFYNPNIGSIESERKIGLFANPNEAGAFANYTLAALLSLFLNRTNKGLLIILILISIFITLSTFSKAAFICMSLMLVLFFLYTFANIGKLNRKTKFLTLTFLLTIGFLISLISLNTKAILNKLSWSQANRVVDLVNLSQGKLTKNSTSERDVLWKYAFEIIPNKFLFGHGLGSFHRFSSGPKRIGVHNTYLMIIGESGIFVFTVFLFSITLIIISIRKLPYDLRFFGYSFLIVFLLNELMSAHHTLSLRYSNVMLAIILVICYNNINLRKSNL